MGLTIPVALSLWLSAIQAVPTHLDGVAAHRYTNSWAVEVRGGTEVADRVAERHGFVNAGRVSCAESGEV